METRHYHQHPRIHRGVELAILLAAFVYWVGIIALIEYTKPKQIDRPQSNIISDRFPSEAETMKDIGKDLAELHHKILDASEDNQPDVVEAKPFPQPPVNADNTDLAPPLPKPRSMEANAHAAIPDKHGRALHAMDHPCGHSRTHSGRHHRGRHLSHHARQESRLRRSCK